MFFCNKIRAKFSNDGNLEKKLTVEITAVEGPMVVLSTGASNFQVNLSKLRRPWALDLQELPDLREGRAHVL